MSAVVPTSSHRRTDHHRWTKTLCEYAEMFVYSTAYLSASTVTLGYSPRSIACLYTNNTILTKVATLNPEKIMTSIRGDGQDML